jgi:hypothetical protein
MGFFLFPVHESCRLSLSCGHFSFFEDEGLARWAGSPIGFSSGGLGLFDGGTIGSFVETSTQMGLTGVRPQRA